MTDEKKTEKKAKPESKPKQHYHVLYAFRRDRWPVGAWEYSVKITDEHPYEWYAKAKAESQIPRQPHSSQREIRLLWWTEISPEEAKLGKKLEVEWAQ